jgi:hypothetical protein
MEVHQLKDRASQHTWPSNPGVAPAVDNVIHTIALVTMRSSYVPTKKTGGQTFEAVWGG